MTEPGRVTEAEAAARAVLACLTAVEEHLARCRNAHQRDRRDDDPDRSAPNAETIEEIAEGADRVRVAKERAAKAIRPFEWDLPSIAAAPVETKGLKAASWCELTIRLAARLTENLPDWRSYDELDVADQKFLFRVAVNAPLDLQEVEAGVKIEAAKLRDRLRALSTDSRFGLILRDLTPQSRKLFTLLIHREGQIVTHDEIAEELWGDDEAGSNRIHQAKHALVDELRKLGYAENASDIVGESGAYRFR